MSLRASLDLFDLFAEQRRRVRHRHYVLPAEQLRSMLGIASVAVRVGDKPLAITDTTLAE